MSELDLYLIDAQESFKNKDIPSFIVGVTNVENEIYFKGCGSSVIRDPASKEINPDSVHWMCSSTKLIIAVRECGVHTNSILRTDKSC